MIRRIFTTAAVLVIFAGFGHAAPPEYNAVGRDMYGNTVEQNDAIRLRGTQEKARFAQETSSAESAENIARLRSLIPGAVLLTVLALFGAVVYRARS
jgi:hypothetical protein